MSEESKAWKFTDGTKVTTSSSGESMDYFYASAPEYRPRFPHDPEDPFVDPGGSVGLAALRNFYSPSYLAGSSYWNMGTR